MRRLCKKTFSIVVSFVLSCLLVAGCATTKKITEKIVNDIVGTGNGLKKKIALLPTALPPRP